MQAYPNQPQHVQPGINVGQPAYHDPYQNQQYGHPQYQQQHYPAPMMHTAGANYNQCIGQTSPISVKCPHCNVNGQTRVKCQTSTKVWICCLLWTLPIIIGCIPCCCLPFLIPSWYEYKHYCQSCGKYVGASQTGDF